MAKLEGVADGVKNLTKSFNGEEFSKLLGPFTDFLKDNNTRLATIFGNMATISSAVAEGKGSIGRLIHEDTLYTTALTTVSTTGINASALSTGTVPNARLDSNIIFTTSTTGINASALSTGTVPLARLASANSSANGIVDTTTQTFAGNKSFANNVTITGNLNVLGTTTTVSANNLIIDDSLIQLAANNTTSDALDIGLYGNYNADGGSHEHTGLFRDTTDDTWKLFKGLQEAPTTTVNVAGAGYTVATLQSYLSSGALTTNTTALQITANSTYNANLTVNTVVASGNINASALYAGANVFAKLSEISAVVRPCCPPADSWYAKNHTTTVT